MNKYLRRYVIHNKDLTTLGVDKDVHALVKLYAREKGLTVHEATYVLLGKGLAQEAGFKEEEISQIG